MDFYIRFAQNRDFMGQCKLSQLICADANSELLDIIVSGTSTLITRASALDMMICLDAVCIIGGFAGFYC